jgi:hypothetical protein
MVGLSWSMDECFVNSVSTFQLSGEHELIAVVSLAYLGGIERLRIPLDDVNIFQPYKGLKVSCSGRRILDAKNRPLYVDSVLKPLT